MPHVHSGSNAITFRDLNLYGTALNYRCEQVLSRIVGSLLITPVVGCVLGSAWILSELDETMVSLLLFCIRSLD